MDYGVLIRNTAVFIISIQYLLITNDIPYLNGTYGIDKYWRRISHWYTSSSM